MVETRRNTRNRGFTTIEVLSVIAIMLIMIAFVALNATKLVEDAKKESALSQISAVFRGTRQAAVTHNDQRRVVLEMTYSEDAVNPAEVYDENPVLRFWVQRKLQRNLPTWVNNHSPPVSDVQTLPGGVVLVDMNGRKVLPSSVTSGQSNGDGTRSFKSYVVFNSKGVITQVYHEQDQEGGDETFRRNLALHFFVEPVIVDLGDGVPPGGVIDYLSLLTDSWASLRDNGPRQELVNLLGVPDHNFRGRTQTQTLYLLRLTGQSADYDYGIYAPWPIQPLPEDFEAPS